MRRARLTRGAEVDFKLRRHAAWLKRLGHSRVGRPPRTKVFETRSRTYGRKSVIKASYTRNFKAGKKWSGRMEAHARYLEQGHDHEPGYKAPGFARPTTT